PAWRAMTLDLNTSLRSGSRGGRSESGLRLARNRLRGLLVASELALSLLLLTGAGLLIRSYARLQEIAPGFATEHVVSMQVAASGPKYAKNEAVAGLFQEIETRIRHLPGVEREGLVSALPLTGMVGWGGINVEGYTPPPGQELQVDHRIASADYFRAMEIPLRKGRFFTEHDNASSQEVAIVDEKFAQRFWPRDNPIGKKLWFDPKRPIVIVGVVGVVKQYGLDNEGKIATYFPHQQQPSTLMYVVARTAVDQPGLARAMTREISAVEPGLVVYDVRTMRDRLHDSLARQRFSTTMLGGFAGFALLLAAVGVYGVMSYLVSQSTHDIGVYAALGAQPRDILGLVVRQGMELAVMGIAAGLVGAFLLSRVMASLLFGVAATDILTFGAVVAILAGVALLATLVPARRASRVDPMVALREE
ncbi:MAG TPA: FtsX-like permease family protein, partial [Bryobacteraceae bacterium]|nr:FtsX-like permease family protein [Bryobacteraceae bacterium]